MVISWVEECHHEQRVRVPRNFDPEETDLTDALAELDPDGFAWLERTQIEVVEAEQHHPAAQYLDPPRYDEPTGAKNSSDIPAGGGEAVMIPGDVWRSFLAQETTLDDEHPGQVSLSAVVAELLRMTAERSQASADG
ncbi:hypothetical protein BEL07_08350 [Mycolicibacterium grossiae]|uniref:Uncharacterized protein n=1 Tax=Mycolicibacterium grossiae TaxID=1552759 RepID=A0A1E8Q8E1_9MYCO|nr:hypothetical protein BEL07_08350 [Mycolicibacterium grossiae]